MRRLPAKPQVEVASDILASRRAAARPPRHVQKRIQAVEGEGLVAAARLEAAAHAAELGIQQIQELVASSEVASGVTDGRTQLIIDVLTLRAAAEVADFGEA